MGVRPGLYLILCRNGLVYSERDFRSSLKRGDVTANNSSITHTVANRFITNISDNCVGFFFPIFYFFLFFFLDLSTFCQLK